MLQLLLMLLMLSGHLPLVLGCRHSNLFFNNRLGLIKVVNPSRHYSHRDLPLPKLSNIPLQAVPALTNHLLRYVPDFLRQYYFLLKPYFVTRLDPVPLLTLRRHTHQLLAPLTHPKVMYLPQIYLKETIQLQRHR